MKRISTDKAYLVDGRVVVDADGVPVELSNLPSFTPVSIDLRGKLREGVTAEQLELMVKGFTATLYAKNLEFSTNISGWVVPGNAIPQAYRPQNDACSFLFTDSRTPGDVATLIVTSTGGTNTMGAMAGNTYTGSVTWQL